MNEVTTMEARFRVPEASVQAARDALRSLAWLAPEFGEECGTDGLGPIVGYSGADTRAAAKALTFEEAVEAWGWTLQCDDLGHVVGITGPTSGKLGDEDRLFEAIAPFVEDGGYIQVQRDDDLSIWRWVFENGTCRLVRGRLVFD